MWYFVLYLIFAAWVFTDAKKLKNHPVGWPTAVLGPIVLPVYFAKRNLQAGAVREGGAMAGMVNPAQVAGRVPTQVQKAGAVPVLKLDICIFFDMICICSAGHRVDPRSVSQEVEHRGTWADWATDAGFDGGVGAAGVAADAVSAASAGGLISKTDSRKSLCLISSFEKTRNRYCFRKTKH